MRRNGLSQEWLKGIACAAMLIDHIGVVFLPWVGLRVIGRMAFPIYCFLLCEGAAHTRDPWRYGLRLAVGALLAEAPYDFLFYGDWNWAHSSVMVTLLLGLPAVLCIKRAQRGRWWLLAAVAALLAELLGADYGGFGILMMLLFALPAATPIRVLAMVLICLAAGEPIQLFALLSLIPIGLYSGKKSTDSKVLQWAFYLFYPAHLLVLLIMK